MSTATPPRVAKVDSSKGRTPNKKMGLTVRVEQPVEGCACVVHVMHRAITGKITTHNEEPQSFAFRWYRKRRAATDTCAFWRCPNPTIPTTVSCILWEKSNYFCSVDCMTHEWRDRGGQTRPQRRLLPEAGLDDKMAVANAITEPSNFDPEEGGGGERKGDDGAGAAGRARATSSGCATDEEIAADWVECNCASRTYLPTSEDVGHMLLAKVQWIKPGEDGSSLSVAPPSPVIAAAPLPVPKMPMNERAAAPHQTVPGSRLRVLSYNILAEIYTSKQLYPYVLCVSCVFHGAVKEWGWVGACGGEVGGDGEGDRSSASFWGRVQIEGARWRVGVGG